MSKSDVSEMVNLCKGLGLRVQFETGATHYSVRDPDTDAKLFYISSTPSDTNFKYEIARHLRRLGLLKGNLKFGKFKTITLRKAQIAAESAGERIPLLEDIDGNTEFFRRTKLGSSDRLYTNDAQQEAIDNMAMKLSPRGAATKERLRKTLEEKNMSNTQFVKIAMEVAEERGLRGWKKLNAGQSAIGTFVKDDDKTLQIWGINLVEATLDKIDGLRFDTEPPTAPIDDPAEVVAELERDLVTVETLEKAVADLQQYIENTLGNIMENWTVKFNNLAKAGLTDQLPLRDKYGNLLLELLAETPAGEDRNVIMDRLDKLIGGDMN
jgi:hypothetical protein